MKYKIEDGIEMPAAQRAGVIVGTIEAMAEGQSVFLSETLPSHRSIASRFLTAGKNLGVKMRSRTVDGGIRVWHCGRLKDES
jgi:hypothetical protein